MKRSVDRRLWIVVAVLLVGRLAFLLAGSGSLGGDGLGYVASAQELLRSGNLPPAPRQQLGLSLILAPLLWCLGPSGKIDYTKLPYPGFPGFVGVPIANAIFYVQVSMDLVIVLILLFEAQRLLKKAPRAVTVAALVFLALQPFTAQLTSHVLPDGPAMFFTFVGTWLLWRSWSTWKSAIGCGAGVLFLGFAALARLDMLPVVLATLAIPLFLVWRSDGFAAAARRAAICVPLLLLPCGAMEALQFKSTGELSYVRLSDPPMAKDSATGVSRTGYFAWARTWILFYNTDVVKFGMAEGAGQAAGWDANRFPSYAFRGSADKAEVDRLLTQWRDGGYSPDIDAHFGAIASANQRERPLFTFLIVPSVRMVEHWVNLEGARPLRVSLHLTARGGRIADAGVAPIRLLFVILALVGAWVVWVEQRGGVLTWNDGFGLARLLSLVALLRTLELGVLGVVIWSGLMEPRYAMPALPGALLLSVLGFRRICVAGSARTAAVKVLSPV